jgi:hypothetical protein
MLKGARASARCFHGSDDESTNIRDENGNEKSKTLRWKESTGEPEGA